MYDVIIIGAGPSGSNLARLISKYPLKVLILEKRIFSYAAPEYRVKACGGLLAPDAQKIIKKLKLDLPKDLFLNPQLKKVKIFDLHATIEKDYKRPYINFDRYGFDKYLFEQIPNRVHKMEDALVTTFEKQSQHWLVRFFKDGKAQDVKGKLLVLADGANSRFYKNSSSDKKRPKSYISIQRTYALDKCLPFYTGVFNEAFTDYYGWTIQKEKHLILGGAFEDNGTAHEKFQALQEKISSLYDLQLEAPLKTEGAFIHRPLKNEQIHLADDRLVLIGEAAGLISPTSAEGISYALRSSFLLAKALKRGLDQVEKRYVRYCKPLRINLLFKRLKSPFMYNPKIRKWVMKL